MIIIVPLLEVKGVSKIYGRTKVLDKVSLTINPGEVHAVLGHNGAGKSTLIKLISGVERPDEGAIVIGGDKVDLMSPLDAHNLGIACVYQELHIIDSLTVAQNLFLAHEKKRHGILNRRGMYRASEELLTSFGLQDVDPTTVAKNLSHPQKQLIEILAAINLHVKLLLLDEPTSSLTLGEIDRLLNLIRALSDKGIGIVFITHKLKEALSVSHKVTVLRNGVVVLSEPINEAREDRLVEYIAGKINTESVSEDVSIQLDDTSGLLEVSHLSSGKATDVSLKVQSGQIVGLYGLVGAGRTDFLRAMFGLQEIVNGTIKIGGQVYIPRSPAHALKSGIYYLTEDRKVDGFIPKLSVSVNMVLPSLEVFLRNGFVDFRRISENVEQFMKSLNITVDPDTPMSNLSGGTQQKVLFARALLTPGIRILMLDEPTKGIDIGSKSEIHSLIRHISRQGYAVIVVSSEVEEILDVSDVIYVMVNGHTTDEYFVRNRVEQSDLLRAALGGKFVVETA